MFTVEMDEEKTVIVVLDNEGNHPESWIYIYDDVVYIRQYDEDIEEVNIITLSPEQFYGLMKAMKKNPGVYNIRD
jgi:hypothetical protein